MSLPNSKKEAQILASNQKEIIEQIRSDFFADLLEAWSHPPEEIDILMDQGNAFFLPDIKSDLKDDPSCIYINNPHRGILAASVTPPKQFRHINLRWVYSIMQAGDWTRYGVLIQGDPALVISYERQHEHILSMERVWDRTCDHQFRDSGGLLLEWRFDEPNFFNDYVIRERFKIIARHLHFRLGKIMLPLLEDDYTALGVNETNKEVDSDGNINLLDDDLGDDFSEIFK